ncbi:MAG: 5-formyltetrahydrofolate cyclo-ligase [Alphaproteobacteria bacterium]|jgi:5-formyltetrahydrofolate cyclo-ligase|nr:5-formyltetrahydrofolate cyclo-ligase [Alphaproteobacteria bacterium]
MSEQIPDHGRPAPVAASNRLRRELRAARRSLSPAAQRAHAERAATRLIRSGLLRGAERIALYVPCDGELDPFPLRARLAPACHRFYLPVLRAHAPGRLWFVRFSPGEPLRRNRFGIAEPRRRGRRILPAHALNLILLPLVGFDAACNRLGMGGGFYDRSLAFLGGRRHWRRPRLIGLAHECQRVEALAPQPWDLPLDAVVTEAGVYRRGPSRLPANSR